MITEKENTLDKRWAKVDIKKFVSLLNEFYKKTNFQKFFNIHAEDYAKAEKEYEKFVLSDFFNVEVVKFLGGLFFMRKIRGFGMGSVKMFIFENK